MRTSACSVLPEIAAHQNDDQSSENDRGGDHVPKFAHLARQSQSSSVSDAWLIVRGQRSPRDNPDSTSALVKKVGG